MLSPERLYQVVIEGLEQDFPSLRSLDVRPNNLPAQFTRFIGRNTEIARIRELLESNRFVTLTGPGGTGKTRLGLKAAAEALADFGDGVFFVDLSAVTLPEVVPAAIAAALRVREKPGRPMLATLSDHLRDKSLLVVLDNFEQVVDAGRSVLQPLLQAVSGLKVLVTSRVPLHLYGEQEFPVPPLALADPRHLPDVEALVQVEAVALFVARAAAVKPDFHLTAENAGAVAEITARLDGLPLALELAASRVKLLPPQALLARLERRLPLLTAQDRNLPERQRTLRRTIEWSYELLDEPEQRLFRRLAVLPGGPTCKRQKQSRTLRESSGGTSWMVWLPWWTTTSCEASTPSRARRASPCSRRSASTGASGSPNPGRKRPSVAVMPSTTSRSPSRRPRGIRPRTGRVDRRLESDHDNFRSALTWALQSGEAEQGLRLATALRSFWRLVSHVREGLRWLSELLSHPAAAARTPLRARALTTAADLVSWKGGTEEHLRLAEEAVSIYRDVGDPDGLADALEEFGAAQMSIGRFEPATWPGPARTPGGTAGTGTAKVRGRLGNVRGRA